MEAAVFYSDVQDALVQVPVVLAAPFGTVNQTPNVASAEYFGVEGSLTADLNEWVTLGGNFTVMERSYDRVQPISFVPGSTPPITGADPTNGNYEPQGVPRVKGFFCANLNLSPTFTVTPNIEVASERWTVTSSSGITPPRFYKTGDYALLNVGVDWAISDNVSLLATAKNLGDNDYTLVDGFPEEGRNFSLSLRLRN